jgi:predicted HTH transcriptional regulator
MVRPPVTFGSGGPPVVTIDKAAVIVAEIPSNDGPLYQASGVIWQRRGTETISMTMQEVHAHLHTTSTLVWERTSCAHATLDDLDADVGERYLNLRYERSRSNLAHMARVEMLLKLRCAARDLDSQVRPTTVVKQRNSINGSIA